MEQSIPAKLDVVTTSSEKVKLQPFVHSHTYFCIALAFETIQHWCDSLIKTINSYTISGDKQKEFQKYVHILPVLGYRMTLFGYTQPS